MNKTKKILAIILTVALLATSMAFVISATIGDGNNTTVNVITKFYRLDGTDWVETQKVAPGDVVKMRLFYETDFYTGAGISFVTYDNAFFTDSYGKNQWNTKMNTDADSDAAKYGISGSSLTVNNTANSGSKIYNKLKLFGLITDPTFCETHNGFFTVYEILDSDTCVKLNADHWLMEYDLTVKTGLSIDAKGTGYVDPAFYENTTNQEAASEATIGSATTAVNATVAGSNWDVTPTVEYDTLSIDQYVTFDANGGVFDGNVETMKLRGIIKDTIAVASVPVPYRANYVFVGWIPSDADESTATADDAYEAVPVDYEETTVKALWRPAESDDVTISFSANGGTFGNGVDTYVVTGKTGEAYVQPTAPEREGFVFDGWSATLPDTIPTSNTVISAKWKAKEITVTFTYGEDTSTYTGLCGEALSAPQISVESGYTVEWYTTPDFSGDPVKFPGTYPADDTDYYGKLTQTQSGTTPIKLIPAAGMTTVVDRNGYTETIADYDGVAGTDYTAYNDSTDDEKAHWFVYGLTTGLDETLLRSYVDYTGDGRIEIVPYTVSGGTAQQYGTGAVINLYDAKGTPDDTTDDTLVESFYVVVFCDVTGDSIVTTADVALIRASAAGAHVGADCWSEDQIPYRFKAGNINGDEKITTGDVAPISAVAAGASSVNQATREVSANS